MLVGGENARQIGTIQDVLEGGQHANPDVRSVLIRDKSTTKEIQKPCPNCDRWQEELTGSGHEKNPNATHDGKKLDSRSRRSDPE